MWVGCAKIHSWESEGGHWSYPPGGGETSRDISGRVGAPLLSGATLSEHVTDIMVDGTATWTQSFRGRSRPHIIQKHACLSIYLLASSIPILHTEIHVLIFFKSHILNYLYISRGSFFLLKCEYFSQFTIFLVINGTDCTNAGLRQFKLYLIILICVDLHHISLISGINLFLQVNW